MENGAEREGVESVMSRNLGVPRIYSNRGGEGREFAVVIRRFVLWTRLVELADGISVFFRFVFGGGEKERGRIMRCSSNELK